MLVFIIVSVVVASLGYTIGTLAFKRPAKDAQVTPAAKVEQPKKLSKYETGPPDAQEILELVNAERTKAGVAPLVSDERLVATAKMKADDMANGHYFAHSNPTTGYHGYQYVFDNYPGMCNHAGENIEGGSLTSQNSIDKWMKSKPHREAILDPRNVLTGISVSADENNYHLSVEHFCTAN